MVELLGEKAYVEGLGLLRLLHRRPRIRGHNKAANFENLERKTQNVIDYEETLFMKYQILSHDIGNKIVY